MTKLALSTRKLGGGEPSRPADEARARGRASAPRLAAALAGLGGLAGLACSGAPVTPSHFSKSWQNDGGRSFAAVEERLRAAPVTTPAPLALGLTREGLTALPLGGEPGWTHAAALDARPAVAGQLVVFTAEGELTALDATTGRKLWSVATDGRALRGAADNGELTVATLGGARGGRSLFLVVDRDGNVVQSLQTEEELGTPAVLGAVAFVPWGHQYVSALELPSGLEAARLLLRDQVTQARVLGDALYFGEERVLRFDAEAPRAAEGGGRVLGLPPTRLPGAPTWLGPGDRVWAPEATARDRLRLYALPSVTTATGVSSDVFAASYFPVLLGMSADREAPSRLRWATRMPSDTLGGAAARGGFVVCDDAGNVRVLAAETGTTVRELSFGTPLVGCVVEAGALTLPTRGTQAPAASDESPAAASASPDAFRHQALRLLRDPDSRLAPVQALLLEEVLAEDTAASTALLIALASDAQAPREVRAKARAMLATRRAGVDAMLAELSRHYDYLAGTAEGPPVAPLAQALAATGEKRAAPLLAAHLNDPADSPEDVAAAARALETLATEAELGELRVFFALYRATASDERMAAAVVSAARALLRVGNERDRDSVQQALRDPLTHASVRRALELYFATEPGEAQGG